MNSQVSKASQSFARLAAALDEYLRAQESGSTHSADEFVNGYPDIAEELKRCLESLEFIRHASLSFQMLGDLGESDPTSEAGRTLGDYRILREIGRGGMGVVYEAEQVSLSRRVALKILPFAAILDTRQLQRFRNEAAAAASLEHPNVVQVYGVGHDKGVHYYVMKLIEGHDLAWHISGWRGDRQQGSEYPSTLLPDDTQPVAALTTLDVGGGRPYFDAVARLGMVVAETLQYAHTRGLIHRDIKPSNLMLDRDGKVWVTDFGLVANHGERDLTMTGDVLGTLRYMSPEQAEGTAPVDHRSDVYSVGITLYELLTRRAAFESDNRATLLNDVVSSEPPMPRHVDSSIPVDLETIVQKAIQKEPSLRYATAQELADDLRRFVDRMPIVARPAGITDHLVKWCRRNQRLVISLALILAVCMVGSVAGTMALWRAYGQLSLVSKKNQAHVGWLLELLDEKHNESERGQFEANQTVRSQQIANELLPLLNSLLELNPDDPSIRHKHARAYARLGTAQAWGGNNTEALESFYTAARLLEELCDDHADVAVYRQTLAQAHAGIAGWLGDIVPMDRVIYERGRAIALLERLHAEDPEDESRARELGRQYNMQADLLLKNYRTVEADILINTARAHWKHLSKNGQIPESCRRTAVETTVLKSRYYAQQYRYDEAITEATSAMEMAQHGVVNDVVGNSDLAFLYHGVGVLHNVIRRPDAAQRYLNQAVECANAMSPDNADNAKVAWFLFLGPKDLSISSELLGDHTGAIEILRRAEARAEAVVSRHAKPALRQKQGELQYRLGVLLYANNDRELAKQCFAEARRNFLMAESFTYKLRKRGEFLALLTNCPDQEFRDPAQAVAFATEDLERLPADPLRWQALAFSQFYAGQHAEALESAHESRRLRNGGDGVELVPHVYGVRENEPDQIGPAIPSGRDSEAHGRAPSTQSHSIDFTGSAVAENGSRTTSACDRDNGLIDT